MRSADVVAAIERAVDASLRAFTRMTEPERRRVVRATLDSIFDKAKDGPRLPRLQGYLALKARRDLMERLARDSSLLHLPVAVLARMVKADRRSVRAWTRNMSGVPDKNSHEAGRE